MAKYERFLGSRYLGDIPHWQVTQLTDSNVSELVRKLVANVVHDMAREHADQIRDQLNLIVNERDKTTSELATFLKVVFEKSSPKEVLDAVVKSEAKIIELLGTSFTDDQWVLFLKGIGEIQGLSNNQLIQLAHSTRENPQQLVEILAKLYLSDSSEWVGVLSSNDFLANYLKLVQIYPQNVLHQFIDRKTIQLINWLVVNVLHHSHILIPNVPHTDPLNNVGFDGELNFTPESWYQLANEFDSTRNYSLQAWCQILVSLQQLKFQLVSLGDTKDGITSAHVELVPVQIFMEMRRLGMQLEGWANKHFDTQVSWLDSGQLLFAVLTDHQIIQNQRTHRSLYALLYGQERAGEDDYEVMRALGYRATAVTSFSKFADIVHLLKGGLVQKLEQMRITTQNMITVLQGLDFEDSGVKAEWDVWFLGYQEELSELVKWIGRVLKGEDEQKEKGMRLGDDGDDEHDESVITSEGAAPVIRLTQ